METSPAVRVRVALLTATAGFASLAAASSGPSILVIVVGLYSLIALRFSVRRLNCDGWLGLATFVLGFATGVVVPFISVAVAWGVLPLLAAVPMAAFRAGLLFLVYWLTVKTGLPAPLRFPVSVLVSGAAAGLAGVSVLFAPVLHLISPRLAIDSLWVFGIAGPEFLLACAVEAILARSRHVEVVLFGLASVLIALAVPRVLTPAVTERSIAVLQPMIPIQEYQTARWSADARARIWHRLRKLRGSVDSDVVVWPESGTGVPDLQVARFRDRIARTRGPAEILMFGTMLFEAGDRSTAAAALGGDTRGESSLVVTRKRLAVPGVEHHRDRDSTTRRFEMGGIAWVLESCYEALWPVGEDGFLAWASVVLVDKCSLP